ncbi:MAG: hypothetical protein K6E29_07100 [Cyanobacteria bacterium RUI128]|nr:hypothetical protein [Cyanobacteria bacterium RUI128]
MVSAVSSINQYQMSRDDLEIIRRMQSLGLAPSGNKGIDMQRLQTAEIRKKQSTLAPNSEQGLRKLEGTGNEFSSVFNSIGVNGVNSDVNGVRDQQFGLINNDSVAQITDKSNKYAMIGASQLAELNKLKLGLIA